ncbi:hypothetical protein ACO0R3_002861 [Hanseniaspora guilliermondii]
MVSTTKAVIGITAAGASIISAKSIVQFDLHKHQGSINARSVVSKDSAHDLSFELINQQGFFSVDVSIGTPIQKPVTLLIDTGSSDMWVNGASVCLPETYSNSSAFASKRKRYASSVLEGFELTATYASTYFDQVSTDFIAPTSTGAAAAATGINCSIYGAFNPDLSSTWKQLNLGEPFGIEYVDTTQARGVYGTDSLSINGVSVPNTTFAVASFSNSSQGVLGISLPRDESLFSDFINGTTYSNLPQTLKADGLISKVSYSLFLNSLCDQSGSLLFGAVNPDWYTGELNTVPLVNIYPNFSDIPIEFDITVNGVGIADFPTLGDRKTITKTNFPGVLDSGTTLMQLPPDLAFALADELDFVWKEAFGYFVGGCPSEEQLRDSSIVFNIGGINYYAPLNNFIYTTSSPDVCAFVVSPFQSNGYFNDADDYSKYDNYAILGDVLLTSLVVVYDLESYEITLGVANYEGYASGSGDVEEIISTVPGAKKAPGYSNTWSTWEYITHYSGDESDGLFTNTDEVNPWLSTASFGCGLDGIITPSSTLTADITIATSAVVSSATSSVSSSVATSTQSSSAVSTSAPSASAATSVSASVSTETKSVDTTTLVTITSCKDNACETSTSQALVSIATTTVEGTVTEYTTYCPLTAEHSTTSDVVEVVQSSSVPSSVPSSIGTSTVTPSASSSSEESSSVSTTSQPSVAPSYTPAANTTVEVVSSENGVAKQIAGSFMALAAGLVAVL